MVTNPGSQTSTEGNTVSLQIQAADPDDEALSYSATGLPLGLSIEPATGLITGTVVSTFAQHGPYTVVVSVSDTAENTGTASFVWTVDNVAPVVIAHNYGVTKNTPLIVNATLGVLSGSSDPGGETIQAFVDATTAHGVLVLNSDGSFTYTPNNGYFGPDSFTYHAFDGLDSGNVATVTLNVGDITPPVVTNPGPQTSTEGNVVSLQVQAVDPDDEALSYSATGLPLGLSIAPATGLITGTVVSTFAQHGPYDVVVSVSDTAENTGTASFVWTVDNVAPVVIAHSYGVTKNTPLIVNATLGVLSGSSDPGGETIQAFVDATTAHGVLVLNSDGSFTYTPNNGYFGPDSFTYHAFDGLDSGNVATVTLNVGDITPPVVTNPGSQTSTEGNAVSLQVQAVDPDDEALSYSATGLPLGLSIAPATGLITGTVVSTFAQHGPYDVVVSVSDTAENTGTASFVWTVDNVAPVVIAHSYGVTKNTPLIVNATLGALSGSSDPGGETIQAFVDATTAHGVLVLNSDGSFTYTPNNGYFGPDSFTYHAFDGLDSGNVATVTLNVGDITPPVVTNPGSQTSTEGNTVSLQVQAVDPDDEALSYSATGLPLGLSIAPATGLITGTVVSTFAQHGPYDVVVSVSDTAENTGTASFVWTVDNVAPVVIAHNYGVTKNTPLIVNATLGVLSGSSDPGGETIQAFVDVTTAHGTLALNSDGSFTYTPDTGYFGPDSFTYHALRRPG